LLKRIYLSIRYPNKKRLSPTFETASVIKVPGDIYIPSSFTPNGDGRNDVFRIPPNTSIQLQQFSIYDRWGRRIFFTQNRTEGWDGRLNGIPLSTRTYIYIIRGENDKGAIDLKGSFTLIR